MGNNWVSELPIQRGHGRPSRRRTAPRALIDQDASAAVALRVGGLPLCESSRSSSTAGATSGTIQTYITHGGRGAGSAVGPDELLRVPCDLDLGRGRATARRPRRSTPSRRGALRDALRRRRHGARHLARAARGPRPRAGRRRPPASSSTSALPAHRLLPAALVAPERQIVVTAVCGARPLAEGRPPMGIVCAQQDVARVYPLPDDPERCLEDFLELAAEHARRVGEQLAQPGGLGRSASSSSRATTSPRPASAARVPTLRRRCAAPAVAHRRRLRRCSSSSGISFLLARALTGAGTERREVLDVLRPRRAVTPSARAGAAARVPRRARLRAGHPRPRRGAARARPGRRSSATRPSRAAHAHAPDPVRAASPGARARPAGRAVRAGAARRAADRRRGRAAGAVGPDRRARRRARDLADAALPAGCCVEMPRDAASLACSCPRRPGRAGPARRRGGGRQAAGRRRSTHDGPDGPLPDGRPVAVPARPGATRAARSGWSRADRRAGWTPITVPNVVEPRRRLDRPRWPAASAGTARTSRCPTRPGARRGSCASSRSTTARGSGSTASPWAPTAGPTSRSSSASTASSADGTNRLVVRVDSRRCPTDFPPVGPATQRRADRRLVELRRDPARGLPAARRHGRLRRASTCARSSRAGRAPRPCRVSRRAAQRHDAAPSA